MAVVANLPPAAPPSGKRIQAADRVIDILELLAAAEGGRASLTAISATLGLQPSSTHHLLATLRARRFVIQDPTSKQYQLGERVIELGHQVLRSIDLATLVRPAVLALRAAAGQDSLFVVFRGCHRSTVVRAPVQGYVVRPSSLLQQAAHPASSEHATGSGKLLLAYLPEDELQQFLRTTTLHRYTDRTITAVEALRAELEAIRCAELAIDTGECDPRLGCLSAPVRDASQRVFGCLDLIYALSDHVDTAPLADALRGQAERLTSRLQALGYRYT